MKKSLFLFLLVAFCNHLHAQRTAAILINNNSNCTVHVTLYATDAATSNGLPCDIMTADIDVPASSTWADLTPMMLRRSGRAMHILRL